MSSWFEEFRPTPEDDTKPMRPGRVPKPPQHQKPNTTNLMKSWQEKTPYEKLWDGFGVILLVLIMLAVVAGMAKFVLWLLFL